MHIRQITLVTLMATSSACAQPTGATALTPPMGWNPWNAFHTEVSESKILAVAEKLKQSGLADAGYVYVNMDDGWWLRRRADGGIDVRTSMFPSADLGNGKTSMRPWVDRLHAMGLMAGIYTDIGRNSCSQAWEAKSPNLPVGSQTEREIGTYGYQQQDMRLLLGDWNFDYVKIDACGLADYGSDKRFVGDGSYRAFEPIMIRNHPERGDSKEVEALYARLKRALVEARPLGDYVLSICTWGEAYVNDWGGHYGNLWRTSADIRASWSSMLQNFDSAASRPLYAGPGHWNDPDMLEIGLGDFDASHPVEARAHMSLWAIISAPLILGADLSTAPQSVFDIVGNREVIAINQDPARNQGVTIARDGDTQVIAKTLAQPGRKAVALVNRGKSPRTVSVSLARLNLASATVRDVWTGKESTVDKGVISVDLAPHETALLTVQGKPRRGEVAYLGEMPARVQVLADGSDALPAALRKAWVPVQADAAPSGEVLVLDGRRIENGIGALANSRIAVRLDGAFRRFRATAGAMDTPALGEKPATTTWRVYGDGKLLFERTVAVTTSIDVPVAGVKTLELAALSTTGAAGVVAWGQAELAR
ncbi:RICIN domain-containing protein [Massilia terrae]|uniref:Alpha-galactosidase n=1 Tax=Massilia terrae TaxID=1811224 RepID=A0ABT2CV07_9BURK|nr:NPCBM/NEW2 domain-containing protein [Massilia terrae]MCS0657789.1 NPCBM/NEW2 domain-containing protein [Massilia terrae]